ncbi:Intracellular exo-alpha-L-arabinofuranosidase 2 [Rubripirellula amarantea]|uniref:non-reducing end alpha-L-arabinofuranosidase n=1 Tax=Rubripirellula amarantea TaxID=2527999 RepID=A0A5C5WVZ0_9BACT|nr:alpha-L-arabinofuranosidase C-terminal domain-containing protein [Rubripirellula amarantea]TWT54856.1 Intracellular exo-alpha-L-arabinofuranosidase 2 [Rubripirellula amarantea]
MWPRRLNVLAIPEPYSQCEPMRTLRYLLLGCLSFLTATPALCQIKITVDPSQTDHTIAPEIYGQFAEHLGGCIYGGLWVGPESNLPNVRGYRKDVLEALKQLKVPVLRWPGGCFADDYHWRDGIGQRDQRPRTLNIYWGGEETNAFGTHEFLDLCELLDCEAYVAGNVGSGTVEEMREWVEYMTSDSQSELAQLRRKNGREKPWRVKYFGVGNENWGCGGNMTAEYYSDLYRRYATYVRDFSGNRITKVANGPSGRDLPFMKTLVGNAHEHADAFSMHYYVLPNSDWNVKGSALNFPESEWFSVMQQTYQVKELIEDYIAILDESDPDKRLDLYVDEWGTWYDPGTDTPSALYQQNSIRDAVSAALFLHIFHEHADRITMGNIAQVVNVLQAMILTRDDEILLTPTYHVFEMYKVHQGSSHIPLTFESPIYTCDSAEAPPLNPPSSFKADAQPGKPWINSIDAVSASASLATDGTITVSLVNTSPTDAYPVEITYAGNSLDHVNGRVLRSDRLDGHNTFDTPDAVQPRSISNLKTVGNTVQFLLPPASVSTVSATHSK